MARNKKSEYIEIELSPTDAAKAKVLCERKGLPFPSGISFLVQEVVNPVWKDVNEKVGKKVTLPDEHTGCRKSAVKKPRATLRRVRSSR